MNQNLEKKISEILINKKLTITAAESCTGGLVTSRLTDIPGSSAYIHQGLIVYSNDAKMKYLDVNEQTLKKHGAVSEEIAIEMAHGVLKNTDADIALSITGIAGPTGDKTEKPVGLVYICAANAVNTKVKRFCGDNKLERTEMKRLFSDEALKFLLEFLVSG